MAHEDAWQWRPNLIWYDNLASYATPNYYVQQLFSLHRGDFLLPVELDDPRPAAPPAGRIGLGTYRTSAQFKELKVTQGDETLLDGRALNSTDDMSMFRGRWEISDGTISQSDRRGNGQVLFGDQAWNNYTLSLKARKLRGREGFVVFVRNGSGGSYLEWNIGGWNNQRHGLIAHLASHSDTPTTVAESDGTIDDDRWYDVRVELDGSQVRCFLDDELLHDVDLPNPPIANLFATASYDREAGESILKLVNPTDDATAVDLNFRGATEVGSTVQVIELAGGPADENSIDDPTHVSPRKSERAAPGAKFTHTFPPHSFTVMRLPTK
jgi:hypothetical protein